MPFQKHLRSREFDAGIEERCRHILVLTDCSTHSNLRLLGPWSVAGNFLPSVFVTSQKIIFFDLTMEVWSSIQRLHFGMRIGGGGAFMKI